MIACASSGLPTGMGQAQTLTAYSMEDGRDEVEHVQALDLFRASGQQLGDGGHWGAFNRFMAATLESRESFFKTKLRDFFD